MLFTIERNVIRASTRFLRKYCSKTIQPRDVQEFILQSNDDFTSIRREGEKSLKIALLGAPNVGKSTIVNQLTKRSVCPVSSKVHTTQIKVNAIYSENDTQLIFIDTPGVVSMDELKKFKLNHSFRSDPQVSLKAADIVGIVQDVHNIYTRDKINSNILELLEKTKSKVPIILILNKVDKLKKKNVLLHFVNVLTKSKNSLNFSDVFMISAITGDGIDDLRTYLLDSAKPQDWHYEKHMYCDQTCEDIIQQTVRAKLLDTLPHEVPYTLQVKLEHFDVSPDDSIQASVSIICPTNKKYNLLLRNSGNKIKKIAIMAERELSNAFRTVVRLMINVQCNST